MLFQILLLLSLLVWPLWSHAQQAPPPAPLPLLPQVQATCEDKLLTLKNNFQGLVSQVVDMESDAVALRREYAKAVEARDAFAAKLKALEETHAAAEKK